MKTITKVQIVLLCVLMFIMFLLAILMPNQPVTYFAYGMHMIFMMSLIVSILISIG